MAKFKDLSLDLETGEHIDFDDADTIRMGYDGVELYLTSTLSGVRAVEPYHMVRYDQLEDDIDEAMSGASGHTNIQLNFYRDTTHPYAENDNTSYLVMGDGPYTPLSVPFDTAMVVIRSADITKDHNGWMQIYDVTNNKEIIEFSWTGVRDWTAVTASGFNNVPALGSPDAVWEIRIKEDVSSLKMGWITHVLLY